MHFQIRKKEKCLLFSIVCYLLIVSSALFLMFLPVSAYTLIKTYDVPVSTIDYRDTIGFRGWNSTDLFNNGEITKIEIDFDGAYTTNNSMPLDGTAITGFCGSGWSATDHIKLTWHITSRSTYSPGTLVAEIIEPVSTSSNWACSFDTAPFMMYNQIGSNPGYDGVFATFGTTSTTVWAGTYRIYNGSATPDVPEITDFTVEKNCYYPNESVILHANVTGTVDTWNWKVYDLNGTVISETSDPVDTVTDPIRVLGSLAAKVTVTNAGGVDDYYRMNFINVSQAGTCNFTPYNPFPIINTTPTQNIFQQVTKPPSVLVNITGVNDIIDNSYLGNMSAGYRSYVDSIGEGFNTTLVGAVSVVQSPFIMIINGIAEGVTLFSVSINSLMSYTTIPLAIVGITLSYYPWQIITLITAGIAVDAIFVLVFGVK